MGRVRLPVIYCVRTKLTVWIVSIPDECAGWQSARCEKGKLVIPPHIFEV
jgi:hypothetical protein